MNNKEENECPICTNIPPGKIFQCREGHVVCESCLSVLQENAARANSLPKCPSCAGRLDNDTVGRCRVLENLLDRLTFECCHRKNGCSKTLKRDKIYGHESSCLYGLSIGICWMFGNANCNFKLSTGTACTVIEHITSSHSSTIIQLHRFSNTWKLKEIWEEVSAATNIHKKFTNIVQLPYSREYVAIIAKVSKDCVSFFSVDLTLALSAAYKPRVTFSIPNVTETLMTCSIPVACGIQSWQFLRDAKRQKPIEIGINSLLQHCDQHGKLKIDFEVEEQRVLQHTQPAPPLLETGSPQVIPLPLHYQAPSSQLASGIAQFGSFSFGREHQ